MLLVRGFQLLNQTISLLVELVSIPSRELRIVISIIDSIIDAYHPPNSQRVILRRRTFAYSKISGFLIRFFVRIRPATPDLIESITTTCRIDIIHTLPHARIAQTEPLSGHNRPRRRERFLKRSIYMEAGIHSSNQHVLQTPTSSQAIRLDAFLSHPTFHTDLWISTTP